MYYIMSERPRCFTEVIAMLTSIDEDDSEGKSETEESNVLNWELYFSDQMSDNEETEQFNDAQSTVHIADTNVLQTAVIYKLIYKLLIYKLLIQKVIYKLLIYKLLIQKMILQTADTNVETFCYMF